MPEIDAKIFALRSCPLDIGYWKVAPTTKPDWWPNVPPPAAGLDSTPGAVWRHVESLWQGQWGRDVSEILIHASGHVLSNETTIYDLEIFGAFQKFVGGADPSLNEVADWLDRRHTILPNRPAPSIQGEVKPVRITDHIQEFEGWSLIPAAFRLLSWSSV